TRRGERAPEAVEQRRAESRGDEIPDEGRRDDDWPRTHHPHRDGDEELALVQPARLLDQSLLEEGHDHQTAAERERAGFQEERQELAEQRAQAGRRGSSQWGHRKERCGARDGAAASEQGAVVQGADDAAPDEDERDLRLDGDGDDEGGGRQRQLQPVLHAELREPVTRVQDEGDDRRTDPVEDVRHGGQALELDVQRAQGCDDDEVRQDEGPAARPRAPEAAPDVGNPDANLDGEGPPQRLAHSDALAHLFLGEPLLVAAESALHLTDEGHRPAEAEDAEPQVVPDELADGHALDGLFSFHAGLLWLGRSAWSVTLDVCSSKRYGQNRCDSSRSL